MKNLSVVELKIKKKAYIKAVYLVKSMEKYSFNLEDRDNKDLDLLVEMSSGMPLPSGRWGNAIALALETNNYIAAEYLIDNATRLGLKTDIVSSEFGYNSPFTIKEEFLYSLLTYDEVAIPNIYNLNDETFNKYTNYFIKNNEACYRIEKRLNISKEDKNILTR